jgi:hypothetical protein
MPTWICSYPITANPAGAFKGDALVLTFSVDETAKHAQVTSHERTHDVEVFAGTEGLTFVDRQKSGAILVTTIDSTGKSVHSKHTILGGALIPSQAYGRCVAG